LVLIRNWYICTADRLIVPN